MPDYQRLTDDELLHIAEDRAQLTDEALVALDGELSQRKISAPEVEAYRLEHAAKETAEKVRVKKRLGEVDSLEFGFRERFLGRTNRECDASGNFEIYDATLWFVALGFPFFPIATYRVRSDLRRWRGHGGSNQSPIERLPRNWEQIFLTWIKAVLLLWAICFAFKTLAHHPHWLRYIFRIPNPY